MRGAAGSATVDQELLAIQARYEPWPDEALAPFAELGVGAYHLGARGSARAPYGDASGQAWSAAVVGGVGLSYALFGPVMLSLELDAAYLLPGVGVRFAGDTVAEGGHPTLLGTGGLGVRW